MILAAIGGRRRTGAGGLDLDALTVRRQIAPTGSLLTGKFYPSSGAAQTYEYTHTTSVDAQTLIAYVDASTAGGTLTLTVDGTTHRATFGGLPAFTIATSAPVASDPIAVAIPAGTAITARLFYEAVGEQHDAAKTLGVFPTARWGTGDLTADGVGITDVNNSQRYLPSVVAITGLTRPTEPAILGIGDSIFESGSGNPSGYTVGVRDAGRPFLNAGRWAGSTIANGDAALTGLLDHFTHALDQYGFNDLSSEAVTKTMADKLATWDWLHAQNAALSITACTVTPSASSTDGYATLANQTASAGTTYGGLTRHQRATAYNGWIRDGAPILAGVAAPGTTDPAALRAGDSGHPLAGWLEVADTVESSRDSGIFRVDAGPLTSDGAHMNTTGGAFIAAAVQAWAESLTVTA